MTHLCILPLFCRILPYQNAFCRILPHDCRILPHASALSYHQFRRPLFNTPYKNGSRYLKRLKILFLNKYREVTELSKILPQNLSKNHHPSTMTFLYDNKEELPNGVQQLEGLLEIHFADPGLSK